MFLAYGDLAKLFPNVKGIRDEELVFHTVAASSGIHQPKGIFIPVEEEEPWDLQEAIKNGAIAAVWGEGTKIPFYTPNHFPIFFTNDLSKGLKDMMELYLEQLKENEAKQSDITNFLFLDEKRLKENNKTYDIAGTAEKLHNMAVLSNKERRG